ncbi:MAG: hypothetical protein EOP05_12510, partial [Proteobacteria bacterium]
MKKAKAKVPAKSKKKVAKPTSKKTAKPSAKKVAKKKIPKSTLKRALAEKELLTPKMKLVRFAGVCLGGGKTDRTAVAILDFFPEQKRVFLRSLRERVTSREDETGDEVLLDLLNEEEGLTSIAFDVPLQFPVSVRVDMKGEKANEAEVVAWMEAVHRKRSKEKRPNKMFT